MNVWLELQMLCLRVSKEAAGLCLKQKECTNVWDIEGSLSKCS